MRGTDSRTSGIIPAYAGSTAPPRTVRSRKADHPRIRGEHSLAVTSWAEAYGSSPHTRGARMHIDFDRAMWWIIPAYAGSTDVGEAAGQALSDHPRIRGEHGLTFPGSAPGVGSSPHTRGARGLRAQGRPVPGIIPAYAGSTRRCCSRWPATKDHPRIRGEHRACRRCPACLLGIIPAYAGSTTPPLPDRTNRRDHPRIRGEHAISWPHLPSGRGSSPHTRGALANASGRADGAGIIPAYAGSTGRACRISRPSPDHPRIRGEHGSCATRYCWGRGSSPHTRGAPGALGAGGAITRIIPAYAGSTAVARPASNSIADHPRIRGEHTPSGLRGFDGGGSSPHTRGAPAEASDEDRLGGIIPAYAGSTLLPSTRFLSWPDHPRIRGEHYVSLQVQHLVLGSSPHTRGAPKCAHGPPAPERIIPAYAGSTARCATIWTVRQDHPRIRGEHPHDGAGVLIALGSSPHTRGALDEAPLEPCEGGDHPRIRGEHRLFLGEFPFRDGSSPHTRGAQASIWATPWSLGIIPAYAGSTSTRGR